MIKKVIALMLCLIFALGAFQVVSFASDEIVLNADIVNLGLYKTKGAIDEEGYYFIYKGRFYTDEENNKKCIILNAKFYIVKEDKTKVLLERRRAFIGNGYGLVDFTPSETATYNMEVKCRCADDEIRSYDFDFKLSDLKMFAHIYHYDVEGDWTNSYYSQSNDIVADFDDVEDFVSAEIFTNFSCDGFKESTYITMVVPYNDDVNNYELYFNSSYSNPEFKAIDEYGGKLTFSPKTDIDVFMVDTRVDKCISRYTIRLYIEPNSIAAIVNEEPLRRIASAIFIPFFVMFVVIRAPFVVLKAFIFDS